MSVRAKGRPEHLAPPEVFYNELEAKKYLTSSRMVKVQTELAQRCLELLALPEALLSTKSAFVLDLGCGTGLSGDVLSAAGLPWVGLDISLAMLEVASAARDVEGDLLARDLGEGLECFRESAVGVFDGAISVSALQWLCNVDEKTSTVLKVAAVGARKRRIRREEMMVDAAIDELTNGVPRDDAIEAVVEERSARKRLARFFRSLYAMLKRGARAVFQVYPENPEQLEMMTQAAMQVGFSGGVVVDFPNSTKAKKYYIVLRAGPAAEENDASQRHAGSASTKMELDNENNESDSGSDDGPTRGSGHQTGGKRSASIHEGVRMRPGKRKKDAIRKLGSGVSKTTGWIKAKKERQRRIGGVDVRKDTKYTGRKRSHRF